jgi:site-specific DNA-methyltransferase (adenine-specific)
MCFDEVKHDRQNNLLCYLYLSNHTFLNARLIKQGLADIDSEFPFSKMKLFRRYQGVRRGRGALAADVSAGSWR